MSRRSITVLVITLAAALGFAAIGAFAFSGRGHGSWGYGMTGSSGQYGLGMMGSGYGYGFGYRIAERSSLTGSASLLIRHQRDHCHTWSLNGGPFKAAHQLKLHAGSSLTIINNDVMPHRLVKLAGGAVTIRNGTVMPMMRGYVSQTPGLMSHMGARTTVTFAKAGLYRFKSKAGADYMPGITTTGEDNVLTMTVTVSA